MEDNIKQPSYNIGENPEDAKASVKDFQECITYFMNNLDLKFDTLASKLFMVMLNKAYVKENITETYNMAADMDTLIDGEVFEKLNTMCKVLHRRPIVYEGLTPTLNEVFNSLIMFEEDDDLVIDSTTLISTWMLTLSMVLSSLIRRSPMVDEFESDIEQAQATMQSEMMKDMSKYKASWLDL